MIIRSALKGIHPSCGRVRLISSTSSPLLNVLDSIRNSLREKQQSSSKDHEQFEMVRHLGAQSTNRAREAPVKVQTVRDLRQKYKSRDVEKYQSRKWREGDIYSPQDLSPEEVKNWKTPQKVTRDVFDVLGINPLHEYKVSTPFRILFCWFSRGGKGVSVVRAKIAPHGNKR